MFIKDIAIPAGGGGGSSFSDPYTPPTGTFTVDGNILISGAYALTLGQTGPNLIGPSGLFYQSQLAAASNSTDFEINTLNTRSAGNLLRVRNNGNIALAVGFGLGTTFGGTITTASTSADTVANLIAPSGVLAQSQNSAGASGFDYDLTTTNTRTGGGLFRLVNNGTTIFAIGTNSTITLGSVALADAGSGFLQVGNGVKVAEDFGLRAVTGNWNLFKDGSSNALDINVAAGWGIQLQANNTTTVQLTSAASVLLGLQSIISNSATDGMVYIRTVAGTPTGVPTSVTGLAAVLFDVSASKIWFYNSGWKGIVVV